MGTTTPLWVRVDLGGGILPHHGDLEDTAITKILAKYKNTNTLEVDVYEIGHHGSHNGTKWGGHQDGRTCGVRGPGLTASATRNRSDVSSIAKSA
jgi:hypothetical protein